jgi:hypothetical protein
MKASDEYKQNLAKWVQSGVDRYGSPAKFAAQMVTATGVYITGEQFRHWLDLEFANELAGDRLEIVAYDKGMAPQDVNGWLRGETVGNRAKHLKRYQIQAIYDLEHLIEIQEWLTEQVRTVFTALHRCDYPTSAAEFQEYLTRYPDWAATRSKIDPDRIQAIGEGAVPNLAELGDLSQCFMPPGDADRLAAIYAEVTPKRQRQAKTDTPPRKQK